MHRICKNKGDVIRRAGVKVGGHGSALPPPAPEWRTPNPDDGTVSWNPRPGAAMSSTELSEQFGKYRILSHLKSGGMASVYRAEDTENGRIVALKVLSRESAEKPQRLERFRREARQGARLGHDNIVAVYDFGEEEGRFYLALEFVNGIDVEEMIRQQGRLEVNEARSIVLQVARALDYAHRMGMVHRDIKPSNILIERRDGLPVVKLADLGLARGGLDEECRVTADGSTVGTVDYMPPEQARDSGNADTRSDLYSLGCTLYHMLSGAPPFAEGTIIERITKHAKAEPADLREINPDVPDDLWAVCRRLLAKKRSQRYQTPAELLADLAPTSAMGPARNGRPAPDEAPTAQAVTGGRTNRIAEAQLQHASKAIDSGNYDYGILLLLDSCRAQPGHVANYEALHRAQKARSSRRGATPWRSGPVQTYLRLRLKLARSLGRPLSVLDYARQLLVCDPHDLPTQLTMADAARSAGFLDLAAWVFETALEAHPEHEGVMRALAGVMEERGDVQQALALWEAVARACPDDADLARKVRDLAARVTTGKYRASNDRKREARVS
jgi:serine/threonine protein kinase